MDTSCDRGSSAIVFDYVPGRTGTDFLVDNFVAKAEDLIPTQWPDCELLEVSRILGELSSSSTTCASSPSRRSWVRRERHSCSCDVTVSADSATSTSVLLLPWQNQQDGDGEEVWEEPHNLGFPFVPRESEVSALDVLLPGLGSDDELPKVFFEWLRNNRDCISPEDLRSIKLKRSTIENAAKRLAGEKHGMVYLLKLILAWVQDHYLQRKRKRPDQELGERFLNDAICTDIPTLWNGGPDNGNSLNSDAPALHPMKYTRIPARLRDVPNLVGPVGFVNPVAPECQAMADALLWQTHPRVSAPNHNQYLGFGSACRSKHRFPGQSPLNYLNFRSRADPASTTKEARKNRMARQKRSNMAHQHHQSHQLPSSSPALLPQSSELPVNNLSTVRQFPRQALLPTDRRQGWAPEKNLKFLIRKVLKQSDVGNLGRIVLPKREAESHLPELEARDGITIPMEDIVTSRVWNMRYRFWPNNKSRMYLLENTGEFIRSNGLREGDFIVIYSDSKTGKYMIRGVKVPRPDTSGATSTKSTTGSSRGDGEDSKLMNTEKSYGATTGPPVAVAFADSMGDASSSVSDAARARACDQDPFLKDMINEFPENPARDDKHHLERFPSSESGDLTIEEMLDLVDSPHIRAESVAKLHETNLV